MRLRHYIRTDAEALAAVYRDAARKLGQQGYTAEQTRVWAMHPEDLEEFRAKLSEGLSICAVVGGSPVAFGQIHPSDHISYLYCHSAHARSGFASAILARLEDEARVNHVTTIRVEASRVARPFFEHHGYRVVQEERPIRHGVEFLRFKMEKELRIPEAPRDNSRQTRSEKSTALNWAQNALARQFRTPQRSQPIVA